MAAAAAKIISPHPHQHPLSSISILSKLSTRELTHCHHQPWLRQARAPTRPKRLLVRTSLQEHLSSSSALMEQLHHYHQNQDSMFLMAESAGYSLASYYTSLGLFVISVPGLWSLIKRSVKSKVYLIISLFLFFFLLFCVLPNPSL